MGRHRTKSWKAEISRVRPPCRTGRIQVLTLCSTAILDMPLASIASKRSSVIPGIQPPSLGWPPTSSLVVCMTRVSKMGMLKKQSPEWQLKHKVTKVDLSLRILMVPFELYPDSFSVKLTRHTETSNKIVESI